MSQLSSWCWCFGLEKGHSISAVLPFLWQFRPLTSAMSGISVLRATWSPRYVQKVSSLTTCKRKATTSQICPFQTLVGGPFPIINMGLGVAASSLLSGKSHNCFREQQKFHSRSSLGDEALISELKDQEQLQVSEDDWGSSEGNGAVVQESFPSGEMEYHKIEGWNRFVMQLKLLIALPWQRVKKGSVLKMKLSGKITEQVQTRFSRGVSLSQICQNLIKAAYDPRISGVYLQVDPLDCGWGKIDEIRRHILFYKKSGKFIVGYMAVGGEKEYYLVRACGELFVPPSAYITLYGLKVQATFIGGVLEKLGVEPQIQRIGKYKSIGDALSRKDMSEANREMLTSLLDDIFDNWLEGTALFNGKTKNDVKKLLEEGIFEVERLKQDGWLTDIKYDDEVHTLLKEKLGVKADNDISYVDSKKYSRVKPWTLNLYQGKDQIAVLRAVGGISRARIGINIVGDGIVSDEFIQKIRQARDGKNFKAVILRIDSPGGDALASDLIWRELRLLASKKPLIASMVDVAASGGYYMAMGAGVIVAENLTLTGSIGVVTGKFNLGQLYGKVGFTKEILSRGRFAEITAEQRRFRPDEAELFAKSAQNAYMGFRDKAALSRSMAVEKMEDVAQGRVWTGKAAKEKGLVDAIGGLSKAVAIAKQQAGIPQEKEVKLVELSRQSPSIRAIFQSGMETLSMLFDLLRTDAGTKLLHDILQGKTLFDETTSGIQARMENLTVRGLYDDSSSTFTH